MAGRDETDDTVLADAYGDPDASDEIGDDSVGRVVAPDEGAHGDDEKDEVAKLDVGRDGGDLSAEEAALHLDPDS